MKVISHMQSRPQKSKAEIDASADRCIKMFERVKRNNLEGMFQWHWVLIDSLEIFCDLTQHTYFGPKNILKWPEENHPIAIAHYKTALEDLSVYSLEKMDYLYKKILYSNRFQCQTLNILLKELLYFYLILYIYSLITYDKRVNVKKVMGWTL